jgi:hypothetical protein
MDSTWHSPLGRLSGKVLPAHARPPEPYGQESLRTAPCGPCTSGTVGRGERSQRPHPAQATNGGSFTNGMISMGGGCLLGPIPFTAWHAHTPSGVGFAFVSVCILIGDAQPQSPLTGDDSQRPEARDGLPVAVWRLLPRTAHHTRGDISVERSWHGLPSLGFWPAASGGVNART